MRNNLLNMNNALQTRNQVSGANASARNSPKENPELPNNQLDPNIIREQDYYLVTCPHCQGTVQVFNHEIRCTIFRHGSYKKDGRQMNPHSSKEECDRAFENDLIYGCGKPFRFDGQSISICDYI